MAAWTPVVAHAGPGSTWQAMLVAVALGLTVVFLLAVLGRVEIARPDDLVLPLAAVAIASSLAPLIDEWLSDWIGWAFPVGVVLLICLLLGALTPLQLSLDGLLPYVGAALAVVGGVVLAQPLTVAWHPPPEELPTRDDAVVAITWPEDGAQVQAGTVDVEVEVTGGSIGPGGLPLDQLPADPEEAGALEAELNGERVPVDLGESCTLEQPCATASFPVEVTGGDARLRVEFHRGDGMPFAPTNADVVEFEVE